MPYWLDVADALLVIRQSKGKVRSLARSVAIESRSTCGRLTLERKAMTTV